MANIKRLEMNMVLKQWSMSDKANLIALCNAVDRTYLSARLPYPYTDADAVWWLGMVELNDGKKGVFRAIVVDGKIVGSVSVEKDDKNPLEAELGYMLLTDYWSKGIVTRAVSQICEMVFRELAIKRIVAKFFEANVASMRVLEKNGFVYSGITEKYRSNIGNVGSVKVFYLQRPVFTPPIIIAGPCSVESEAQILATAQALAEIPGVKLLRGGIWKPRTRPEAFEGRGEQGLVWLREAKRATGLPTATEVATPEHVELALRCEVDALWIGARTVVNPFSVQQLADALRGVDVPVFIKNPVSPDLNLWVGAFERFQKAGLTRLAAIHRGFAYYKETPYRNFPMWEIPIELKRRLGVPVITDISHICGNRDLLCDTAQKSIELAFDGLMVECHPDPDHALTDAHQQITPQALAELLGTLSPRSCQADGNDPVLATLRSEIDDIDDELLQLLARRMNVAGHIGDYKKEKGLTIVQMDRWKQILADHLETGEKLGLSQELIEKVFEAIHLASIQRQS